MRGPSAPADRPDEPVGPPLRNPVRRRAGRPPRRAGRTAAAQPRPMPPSMRLTALTASRPVRADACPDPFGRGMVVFSARLRGRGRRDGSRRRRPWRIGARVCLRRPSSQVIDSAPCGPLAQLVEQQTLNLRVRGSSPWRLTNKIDNLRGSGRRAPTVGICPAMPNHDPLHVVVDDLFRMPVSSELPTRGQDACAEPDRRRSVKGDGAPGGI